MSVETISGPNEHPVFRFFCQYPEQLRPMVRQYLITRYFSKIRDFLQKTDIYGILILDQYTLPIISALFDNSTLTEYRLVLKDMLEKNRSPQARMFGVYFVSSTLDAMQMVARDFGWKVNGTDKVSSFIDCIAETKQQKRGCCAVGSSVPFPYKYKGLFIFTPSLLPDDASNFVTASGLSGLLSKAGVMCFNVDYIVQKNRFISLNQPEAFLIAYGMHRFNAKTYSTIREQYVTRTINKLWSIFNSMEMGPPEVRYYKGAARESHFSLCKEIAEGLNKKLRLTPVAPYNNKYPCVNSTLVVIDRAFDPVPLLAHHTLVGSFLPDILDISNDLYLECASDNSNNSSNSSGKSAVGTRTGGVEINLSESSDVWNGFRFMSMVNFLVWQREIIKALKSLDPFDRDAVTLMSKPKELAVNYGRYSGRIMKVPAYSLVDSSIFNVPYMTLSAQMNGAFTVIKKFADNIEAKGYLPYLLAAESALLDVLVNGDRISSLEAISIGQEKTSIAQILQLLSSPNTDSTISLRMYLYIILVLEKSGQTDKDLAELAYEKTIKDVINLSYRVLRKWNLDDTADFRALWVGFLQTFVTLDFVHLWQALKKSAQGKTIEQSSQDSRFIPGTEALFRAFFENPLPTAVDAMFPVAENNSLAMAERRRRGMAVKRDVLIGSTANASARYYPESPEGKELRAHITNTEISSYRSREKVYVYVIGGVTPADVSAAYRTTGDAAIPEPSVFNSVYWSPALGEFDCVLISDDYYIPSRFMQRLAGLKPGVLSSVEDLHKIVSEWSNE